MEMVQHLTTCKDKVKEILEKYPETRDSDKLLWLAYMVKHHKLREQLGDTAYLKLKEIILHEETPPMESLRRMRQKIQEYNPELRGETYKERIKESEEVKEWSRIKQQQKERPSFVLGSPP